MNHKVYRFVLYAKPCQNNRKYNSWETATIVIFVRDDDFSLEEKMYDLLDQHRWQILELKDKTLLIEERIREAKEEIREAYNKAITKGYFFIEFPDNFGAGKKDFTVLAPRISESFVDAFILRLNGRILRPNDRMDAFRLHS